MMSTLNRIRRRLSTFIAPRETPAPAPVPDLPAILLRRALIVRFSGGLANQMICYKAGRYVAAITGRSFVIDASLYTSSANHVNRNFQLLNYDIAYDLLVFSDEVMGRVKAGNDITFMSKEMLCLPHPSPAQKAAVLDYVRDHDIVFCDFWMGMCFRSEMDEYAIHNGVLDELTLDPANSFDERNNSMLSAIRAAANPVAIHVRRGDYATHDGNLLLTREYYNTAITRMEASLDNPVFFVFSDDIDWCKTRLLSRAQLHFIDFNDEQNAFRDMYLASQCSHFILSNESTYSHQIVQLSKPGPYRMVITSQHSDLVRNQENESWAGV